MFLYIFLIHLLLKSITTNNISLVASPTSSIINQTNNITFTIVRTTDSSGNSINPSLLSNNSVITLFMSSFTLTNALCQNSLNCTINSTAITINGIFASNQSLSLIQILVTGIVNPLISNSPFIISCVISTNGQSIDTGAIQITFSTSSFFKYTVNFSPGNVSYNSNLTITIIPSISITSGKINITIPKYYSQSAKNLSINVPSTISCSSTCVMSLILNSIIITVSNIVINYNSSISININGVVSSPTTQAADSLFIVSFDSFGNQYDNLYAPISSSLPNYFSLNNISNSIINKPFSLSFNFYTTNVFAANDTIIMTLPSLISISSISSLQINSSSINTYAVVYILPNIIQISNITTFSSSYNPANITFNLSNVNGPNTTSFISGIKI